MFLTQFEFNTARRGARDLLASPQRLHAAVLNAFPAAQRDPRDDGRILWRVDQRANQTLLYVVSPDEPDLTHLVEDAGRPATQRWLTRPYQPLLDHLDRGQRWAFRLTANPTYSKITERGVRGQRLGHVTITQQTEWLLTRADRCGFAVPEIIDKEPDVAVQRRHTHRFIRRGRIVTVSTATFEGILEITDPDALRSAMTSGIGPAKAYGCGLLTLARP